jgi:protein-tyrosine phosphatase
MAEMVMRHLVAKYGLEKDWEIDSCATSREEIGNDIYPPAKHCLSAHGVPFSRHAARQITRSDYDHFDLILCMEEYNIRNLTRVLGAEIMQMDANLDTPKIRRLIDRDVADPWYTGDFEATYRDVLEGCDELIKNKNIMSNKC